MQPRDSYPPGVTCFVDTEQPDPDAAAAFYSGLFGWEVEDRTPPDMPGRFIMCKLDGLDVAGIGSTLNGDQASAWNTYVSVASVEETQARVKAAGGSVLAEPFDIGTSGRMAIFADPEGAPFRVWQAHDYPGAQVVNAPGSWNFSDLHTHDLEGAKAFYRTVFGWEIDAIDGMTMVRVPGYGETLAVNDPDILERQSEVGAPPGFEDAIAWMVPDADAPPHWHVSFSVDDADAIAARAAELGGAVVVEPFDVPWVRMAVLRDPQGAVFSIGKFQPPE